MSLRRHIGPALAFSGLAALGLAAAPSAQAAVTVYTDQMAFLAAIPGSASVSTLTFNGIADSTPNDYVDEGNSFTEGAVTFTTPLADQIDITSPQFNSGYNYGSGDVIGSFSNNATESNGPLVAALPNGTFAVGFDLGDFNASSDFSVALTPAGAGGFRRSTRPRAANPRLWAAMGSTSLDSCPHRPSAASRSAAPLESPPVPLSTTSPTPCHRPPPRPRSRPRSAYWP